jgi:tRNA-binding protein
MTDITAGGSSPAPDSVPTFDDLHSLQIRIGTVVRAEPNEGARDPAYKLWIDFGPLGEKQSSAKIVDLYEPDDLIGRQVAAVTGFAPLRVGGFRSDVLVIGALTDAGVVLLAPDTTVPDGSEVA